MRAVCQYILLLVLVKQEDMMTHALRESFYATAGRSNSHPAIHRHSSHTVHRSYIFSGGSP